MKDMRVLQLKNSLASDVVIDFLGASQMEGAFWECAVSSTVPPTATTATASSAMIHGHRVRSFMQNRHAYWATPLPNDQFSFATSTRLTKTSSLRSPGSSDSNSAMRANNAFFCSTVRVLLAVI